MPPSTRRLRAPVGRHLTREMARVGVTLKLLHGEYADSRAAGGEPVMGYDRFCRTYQRHVLVTGVASRVGHKAAQFHENTTVEIIWTVVPFLIVILMAARPPAPWLRA